MKASETGANALVAFKEWAVIVDLLGAGDQILILRKGGIHENRGGFQVEHRGFYLFPTLFHQQRESVLPEFQARCDQVLAKFADAGRVPISFWAEAADTRRVTDRGVIEKLAPCHAWTGSVVKDRFGWGKDEGIFVIAVRVFRLAAPAVIPVLKEYGGCKSWIDLDAGAAPSLDGRKPVLEDAAFEKKLQEIRTRLS
jgi:hypothetical protein